MRNVYIFDLDDTLYQIKNNEYINKVDKQELRKLNGIKILFSNATFGHVSILMKELGITDIFNVVFTTDILGGYKPNPLMYEKIMTLCNLNESDNIYFFENLAINLYPAKKYNWKTILIIPNDENIIISNNESNNNKLLSKVDEWLDYKFDNINDALKFINL